MKKGQVKKNKGMRVATRESRTLFIRNLPEVLDFRTLYSLFELYGPIKSVYTDGLMARGTMHLTYYDLRHAVAALNGLNTMEFGGRIMLILYGTFFDNESETLVVSNECGVERFGAVRQRKSVDGGAVCIEYYDLRALDCARNFEKRNS